MTLSRKTCTAIMLLIVPAVVTGQSNEEWGSTAFTPAPAAMYAQAGQSPPSSGVSVSTSTAIPVQYSNGFLYQMDDGTPLIESALVVPAREMEPTATAQVIEDLSVMARIIERNALAGFGGRRNAARDLFAGVHMRQESGPRVLFPSVGRPRPLYIGGYGATFFIQVDFPVLPLLEQVQEPSANPQEDPVWAENRRALFEPRTSGTSRRGDNAPEPYSQEKVDSLRRSLIGVMRYATNIRLVESNEWLAIVVQGAIPSTESPRRGPASGAGLPVGDSPAPRRGAMMLRARKADVDSYAKGEINQAQFEQRVQVMTY